MSNGLLKCVNHWCFYRTPLSDAFSVAVDCGFDGYEVALGTDGEITADTSDAHLLRIRSEAESLGLALPSVATGLYWRNNFASPDPEERARAVEIARIQLHTAATLGAGGILVVPGVVNADIRYDEAYARSLECMRRVCELASPYGVNVCIENVWNKLLLSPVEMRDYIDAVGSTLARAYFDVGNVLLYGYPQHWIGILGNRIGLVHLKDYSYKGGFTGLLHGDVDWQAVMQELRGIGYTGAVSSEISPDPEYAQKGDGYIRDISAAMDKILAL